MASTQKQKTASGGSAAGSLNEHSPGFAPGAGSPRTTKCSPAVREAWIYLAMSRIMLRRLAQNSS
jgi:hypothetical protein